MRHLYECPMRWADLDALGHVNNVVYVDYLQEARVDLLRRHSGDGADARPPRLTDGVVVVRHEVGYQAPLRFRFRPVRVECWVTEVRAASFTMAYEVFHDDARAGPRTDGRRVYARARTVLAPYDFDAERPRRLTGEEQRALGRYLEPGEETHPWTPLRQVPAEPHGRFRLHVRFSDVDVYGHVNNVKYVEYFQEARLRLHAELMRGLDGLPPLHLVVAQIDVEYRRPILFRADPYDCWSSLSRVGRRSMTIDSEIRDGEELLARSRAVMVFFGGGRAVEPPAAYRERLLAAVT